MPDAPPEAPDLMADHNPMDIVLDMDNAVAAGIQGWAAAAAGPDEGEDVGGAAAGRLPSGFSICQVQECDVM